MRSFFPVLPLLALAACGPESPSQSGSQSGGHDETASVVATLTHAPVDFERLFAETPANGGPPISPFFVHDNGNHVEGPRKWYLYGPVGTALRVYLPATSTANRYSLRESRSSTKAVVGGTPVRVDVQVRFEFAPNHHLFFDHLCLLEEVAARIEDSETSVQFEAGIHIGYLHHPPRQSLDFGVEDTSAGDRSNDGPHSWLFMRRNPLDYFVPEVREEILRAYGPVHQRHLENGNVPFSDLTDSRTEPTVDGNLWGIWYREDSDNPLARREAWSVVSLVRKADLHQTTCDQWLRDPDFLGLFSDSRGSISPGSALYPGGPYGTSRVTAITGDLTNGTLRFVDRADSSRSSSLAFQVDVGDPDAVEDDVLTLRPEYRQNERSAESATPDSATPNSAASESPGIRYRRSP